MKSSLDPAFLRRILHRMGETGQPPERGALQVNVGTDELLDVLRREYLVPIRESGRNSAFKLVQAPFGGGKSQFLHCLRELAWREGFVTSLVDVSPQECPFDDPVRIYRAVATRLESPPKDLAVESDVGIDAVLRVAIAERRKAHGEAAVRAWLDEEIATARVDSHAVRRAAHLLMCALLDRDHDAEALLASFLRGEDVQPGEVRALGVREALEPSSAFRFLRSLVQVLRAVGVSGVVLLFDEMDRVMSLSVRRRRSIGDVLRQTIDHCGQASLPSVLWIYAVPPEFLTNVVPEYPALEQRLRGASTFSSVNPLAPVIDLDRLPLGPTALLTAIGGKLLDLHLRAHEGTLDEAAQRGNLQDLARELGERQLEVGTRRTFVKAAAQLLATQQREGSRRLAPDEIRGFAAEGTAKADAPVLPGEDLFA